MMEKAPQTIIEKILSVIIRFIWPAIARFWNVKIETQNHYNPPETEKKAERSEEKPSRVPDLFVWPVDNSDHLITNRFSFRTLRGRKRRMHYGIDVIGKRTYVVRAAESGVVSKIVKPDSLYPCGYVRNEKKDWPTKGKWRRVAPAKRAHSPYVLINAWNGTRQKYAHAKRVKPIVKAGEHVQAGQIIATYEAKKPPKNGGLGFSFGAHVHFEVHKMIGGKWTPINPEKYAKKRMK